MSINLHKFPTLQTHKQNEKKPHPLLNEASTFIIYGKSMLNIYAIIFRYKIDISVATMRSSRYLMSLKYGT